MSDQRWRQRRRRLAWLTGAAGLAAIVVLQHAGRALVVTESLAAPDAIVMLASHEWERLPKAAALARQHPSARVILTVPAVPTYWNCFRCSERPHWLAREGVQRSRIIELGGTINTYGEARAVAAYFRANHLASLLVVTSPYHTRRSLSTFRTLLADLGVRVGIQPAVSTSSATPAVWWKYDVDRHDVAYEWAALGAYALRHGVRPF